MMPIDSVIKIGFLTTLSFVVAIAWTPLLTYFLYKYKLGKNIRDAKDAPIAAALHAAKQGTPTMGGIIVWATVLAIALVLQWGAQMFGGSFFTTFTFLERGETLLPLGALVASALVGLVDDYWNVRRMGPKGGGLSMKHRLLLYTLIAAFGAWWFTAKLEWDILRIPLVGLFSIGWWYIPFFIFVIVATSFSINETDGLDGLAGGVLLFAYATYSAIAFSQGMMNLAAMCGAVSGALLAFLWFNINPARFFMGDTGAMSLGVTLGIVALLTNTAFLLPIILIIPVIESVTVIIQLTSKKLRGGKKVFLSTPIHHHFEAIGWSEPKIVMRAWIITAVACAAGLVLALVDKGYFA